MDEKPFYLPISLGGRRVDRQSRRAVWAHFYPAPDLPGRWIGHCLDADIVTQGDSFEGVQAMLREAVAMAWEHASHVAFMRAAPPSFWQELWSIVDQGESSRQVRGDVADAKVVAVIEFTFQGKEVSSSRVRWTWTLR